MKKASLILALVLLVGTASIAMAGPRGKGITMGPQSGMRAPGFSNLNLTAEQQKKIDAIGEAYHKELAPLRLEMFKKRTELKLLWMQTNLDENKIKAKQKEIHELRGQLQEKRTDFRLNFLNILTPEQRTQFILKKYNKRGHGFRGPQFGPPDHGHGKYQGRGSDMRTPPPK